VKALVLAGALLLTGCSLAPTDDVVRALVASDRSWCVSINTIYGTARMSGTGLLAGRVVCSQEGMSVWARDPDK
jgi:hypothetical protein